MENEPDTFNTLPVDIQESVRASIQNQQAIQAVQIGTKKLRK